MVAISTVKTEDGKVSCETSEGTVINIHVNQRSCMDSILDTIKNVRMVKKDGPASQPDRPPASSPVSLAVGVSCMSLGFVSAMLAIILEVAHVELTMLYSGTHYWVGFPFLAAGVLNVVAYKYPRPLWVVISFIFLLGCLAVSIAGMVFVVDDINRFWWNDMDSVCDRIRREDRYLYETESPRYMGYRSDYPVMECKRQFQKFQNLKIGLIIMSLLMMIWGLCISALTLGYRLIVVWRACKCEKVEEQDDPILMPNPTEDIIIA